MDGMAGGAAAPRAGGDRSARAASSSDDVLFHQYLQWLAGTQWQAARGSTRTASRCSAICRSWSTATAPTSGRASISSASTCRSARRPTRSARPGRTGACRSTDWDVMAAEDFRWLRERARRSADLFDGYRIDHLVGFYRTYGRPTTTAATRVLHAGRRAGAARARRDGCSTCFASAGAEIIAEDLGTVPDFVRASLARLGVPGFRVLALGAALAHDGPAVPRSVGLPARVGRALGHARHRAAWSIWWEHAPEDERGRSARCRRSSGSPRGVDLVRRAVQRRRARRAARGAVRVGFGPAAAADSGRVRLARSHQRAGDRQRRQLDLPAAVAGRSAR